MTANATNPPNLSVNRTACQLRLQVPSGNQLPQTLGRSVPYLA